MGYFSKTLIKWREPKVKGQVTPVNVLTVIGLILLLSIPFGFLSIDGKFSINIWLITVAFLCTSLLAIIIPPLLPGPLIRLREDAIVRAMFRQKSSYDDIDSIYFYRHCSYSNVSQKNHSEPLFTRFEIALKSQAIARGVNGSFLSSYRRTVRVFTVPDAVDVAKIVQLLQQRHVRVQECHLPV